jgi:hypothetical protein
MVGAMCRFVIYLFLLVVLTAALADTVLGNNFQHKSCDIYVNDIRITWPEGWLSYPRCESLMLELISKDNTGAAIECRCQLGSQS